MPRTSKSISSIAFKVWAVGIFAAFWVALAAPSGSDSVSRVASWSVCAILTAVVLLVLSHLLSVMSQWAYDRP